MAASASQPGSVGCPVRYCHCIEPIDRHHPPTDTVLGVLAAGAGSRFLGTVHKLNAPLTIDGVTTTVAQHAIAHALDSGFTTVLVTGAVPVELDHIERHHHRPNLIVVHNPNWADGQASSLRVAVEGAGDVGADAIVVGLADQPFIDSTAWQAVAEARAPIAVATYDGRRRNPVRLHRSVWPDLPDRGDVGARLLIALLPELVQEVPCTGSPIDIDTLEELQTWQSRSSTSSP